MMGKKKKKRGTCVEVGVIPVLYVRSVGHLISLGEICAVCGCTG